MGIYIFFYFFVCFVYIYLFASSRLSKLILVLYLLFLTIIVAYQHEYWWNTVYVNITSTSYQHHRVIKKDQNIFKIKYDNLENKNRKLTNINNQNYNFYVYPMIHNLQYIYSRYWYIKYIHTYKHILVIMCAYV